MNSGFAKHARSLPSIVSLATSLVTSLAVPLHSPSAAAEAKFGPEIELQGRGHMAGIGCVAGSVSIVLGMPAAMTSGAAFARDPHSTGAQTAFAAGAATAGPGLYCLFRGNLNIDEKNSIRYLKKIEADYKKMPPGSVQLEWIEEGTLQRPGLQVKYANGQEILFGQDPNTIEVKFPPATAKQISDNAEFFQTEIFDRAKRAGLTPPRFDGPWNGGHLHIDTAGAFNSDPLKLKNFVMDYVEHGELSGGVMVRDGFNAAPISLEKNRESLLQLANHLDSMAANGQSLTKEELAVIKKKFPDLFGKAKALNINEKFGTLEIRANRSPKDAVTLADSAEVLDRRIQFTNSQLSSSVPSSDGLRDKSQWANRFKDYIEESGLDYERYKHLAPKKYQTTTSGTARSAKTAAKTVDAATAAMATCIRDGLREALKGD